MAGCRVRSGCRQGPGGQDAATQTDSPSCCAALLSQLQATQRELSEARRQLRGAVGDRKVQGTPSCTKPLTAVPCEYKDVSNLDPASPQTPASDQDPLELPSCTTLTGMSNIMVLEESHYPETIHWTPAPACLGPSPLLVKSEPADEEPLVQLSLPPPDPRLHPQCLQDLGECSLHCKVELRDDLQPSDNAQSDAAAAAQMPASPTADCDAPATEMLLPSKERGAEAAGPQQLQQDWAEYAEPCKGELDIEDWEHSAEEDFNEEAAANDTVLLAPHFLSKLQLEPKKSDSMAGARQQHSSGDGQLKPSCWFHCKQCSETFGTLGALRHHMCSVHMQLHLHSCINCGQNSASKDHVCTISQLLPKTQPFTSEECGAEFANKCNHHEHTRTQTGEVPYKCKVCGKYFSQVNNLLIHTRTHINTGERDRQNSFEVCGKAFKDCGHQITHSPTHTEERRYKCQVCGKAFTTSSDLSAHTRTHTGVRPFKCKVCGEAFKQSGNLIRHTRIHTGERPYICNMCGKAFKHSDNLKTHTRTHTEERPYKCQVCGRAFRVSGTLNRHTRTHTGESPYKCEVCGKFFKQASNLFRHTLTHIGKRPH